LKKRLAILISGGGSNMVALAKSMDQNHPARPVLVISNIAGAGGLEKAKELGIAGSLVGHSDYLNDRKAFEDALDVELHKHRVDIICLAGFMRILTPEFTTRWAGQILNIHPSLLPKYPGLHTHARALAAGDTEAGCSVHVVTKELDAGQLLGQARLPVLPGDTAQSLAARVLIQEHLLYPAVLRRFAAGDRRPVLLN